MSDANVENSVHSLVISKDSQESLNSLTVSIKIHCIKRSGVKFRKIRLKFAEYLATFDATVVGFETSNFVPFAFEITLELHTTAARHWKFCKVRDIAKQQTTLKGFRNVPTYRYSFQKKHRYVKFQSFQVPCLVLFVRSVCSFVTISAHRVNLYSAVITQIHG